jgi:hypothetical protein
MQVASQVSKEGWEELLIFGDNEHLYKLNLLTKSFTKSKTGMVKPLISAITKNNKVYGWSDGNDGDVVCFDGENWSCLKLN